MIKKVGNWQLQSAVDYVYAILTIYIYIYILVK